MSTSILTVSAAEFQRRLNANPSIKVIDVRTPLEFSEVHVKEATLVPLDELDPSKLKTDKVQPLYVLCRSGARATKAAERLLQAGFQQPIVVEGGTLACIEAGCPVVRSGKKTMSLERQVRIAAGSLVLLGVVLSLTVHSAFMYLSGFIGAGLVFAGITDWCGMGLLIAKAPWNRR